MTSILKVSEIQDPTNGNSALTVDSSGRFNAPANPILHATGGSGLGWLSPSGSAATITGWVTSGTTVAFNRGFNVSSGVVTVPCDGVYEVHLSMLTEVNNGEYVLVRIKKGSTIYSTNQIYQLDSGRQQTTLTMSCLFEANAGETITSTVQGGGSSPQYYMDANYANFMVKMIG
tara:strand:- start:528 stop:1049 length:522 start_codon:yes stop_codon:yes gene_type:complete